MSRRDVDGGVNEDGRGEVIGQPACATSTYRGIRTTTPGMNMIMSISQKSPLPRRTGVLVKTKAASAEKRVARQTAG